MGFESGAGTASAARRRRGARRTRRRPPRTLALALVALLVVAGVSGATYGYWRTASGGGDRSPGFTTTTIDVATFRDTVSGPGALSAGRSHAAATTVAGTLSSAASVGDRVAAGATLAELDPGPFERAVQDAERSLATARAQLESLVAGRTDSSNSLEDAIASADRAVRDGERSFAAAEGALALAERLHELGSESADAVRRARNERD